MYRAENFLCPIVLFFLKRTLVGVVADLEGSGHSGIGLIGCRRGSWLCLAPAIQPLTLDNGREILIADVKIHIAADTVHTPLLGVLPDAVFRFSMKALFR